MTSLSKHTLWLLTASIAFALVAAAPADAAKGGDDGKQKEGKEKPENEAEVVSGAPVTVAGQFTTGSATATCPKGTQAISGGFTTTPPVQNGRFNPDSQWIDLYESVRVGTRGWRVSGVQMYAGTGTLAATVTCEALKGKVKPRSRNVPLGAAGSTVTALASCPRGTKVLSGGFTVPPANLAASTLISRSIVGNGIGWVVDATSMGDFAAANLTAFAYCADVSKIKTRSASAAVLGPSPTSQTATTPACPKKTSLRGGGFATSTPVNGLLGSALVYESRPSGESWLSSALPGGASTSSTLVTNSYCR